MWPFKKSAPQPVFQFPLCVHDYPRHAYTAMWEIMLEPSNRNGHATVKWVAKIISNVDMCVKETLSGIAVAASAPEAELLARQQSQRWVFSRMPLYRVGG